MDRHVPLVSYSESSPIGGDAVFFVSDACADSASWVLAGCAVDPSAETNLLNDAYGDGFGYHGAALQPVEVDLSAARATAVLAGDLASTGGVPADADGEVLLSIPTNSVSTNQRDDGCATFQLAPLSPGGVLQVVAAEAMVDPHSASGCLAHHLV